MAVIEDETRKQLAAGSEEQGFTFHASFDPFNMIMQQLGKLDTKTDDLRKETDAKIEKLAARFDRIDAKFDEMNAKFERMDAKMDGLRQELHSTLDTKIDGLHQELHSTLDTKIDGLHQELHSTSRWIIGTIVAVAGVAVALASWLLR